MNLENSGNFISGNRIKLNGCCLICVTITKRFKSLNALDLHVRAGSMNALEKLRRLTNPKCAEDYGLSVSLSELIKSGEEGKAWAQSFFSEYVPFDKWPDSIKKEAL